MKKRQATKVLVGRCDNPKCPGIHIVFLDGEKTFAEAIIDYTQIQGFIQNVQKYAYEIATENISTELKQ